MKFDFDAARQEGYSDDEIVTHLKDTKPKGVNVDAALKEGYNSREIVDYLEQNGFGKFNPEGRGYDYETAKTSGMKPGPDGHWGSVAPASTKDQQSFSLPDQSYVLLKGRGHESFDMANDAESARGYEIVKRGERYFSVPSATKNDAQFLNEQAVASQPARAVASPKGGVKVQPADLGVKAPAQEYAANFFGEGGTVTNTPAGFVAGGNQAVAGLRLLSANEMKSALEDQRGTNLDARDLRARMTRKTDISYRPGVLMSNEKLDKLTEQATQAGEAAKLKVMEAQREIELVTPKDMSPFQKMVWSGVTSSASTALGIGVGIASRNPMLGAAVSGATGFAQQAGSTYTDCLDAGGTHDTCMGSAIRQGLIEGADSIPVGVALRAGSPTRSAFYNFLKKTLETAGSEASTEGAQQALQDFDAYVAYNPKMTLAEAWDNFVIAAGAGGLMGAAFGGAGSIASSRRDAKTARYLDTQRRTPQEQLAGTTGEVAPAGTPPPPGAPPAAAAPTPTTPAPAEEHAPLPASDVLGSPEETTPPNEAAPMPGPAPSEAPVAAAVEAQDALTRAQTPAEVGAIHNDVTQAQAQVHDAKLIALTQEADQTQAADAASPHPTGMSPAERVRGAMPAEESLAGVKEWYAGNNPEDPAAANKIKPANPAMIPEQAKRSAGLFTSAFSKEVVFLDAPYDPRTGEGFGGVMLHEDPSRVYVNINNQEYGWRNVIGHEMLHALKRTNARIYVNMARAMVGAINYGHRGMARYENYSGMGEGSFESEEMVADMFGDVMNDPWFWWQVFKQSPNAKTAYHAINMLFDTMRLKLRIGERRMNYNTRAFITNVEQTRKAMAHAYNAWRNGQEIAPPAEREVASASRPKHDRGEPFLNTNLKDMPFKVGKPLTPSEQRAAQAALKRWHAYYATPKKVSMSVPFKRHFEDRVAAYERAEDAKPRMRAAAEPIGVAHELPTALLHAKRKDGTAALAKAPVIGTVSSVYLKGAAIHRSADERRNAVPNEILSNLDDYMKDPMALVESPKDHPYPRRVVFVLAPMGNEFATATVDPDQTYGGEKVNFIVSVSPRTAVIEHARSEGRLMYEKAPVDSRRGAEGQGVQAAKTEPVRGPADMALKEKIVPPPVRPDKTPDRAAHTAATSPKNDRPLPTQAQKEAGNYKKGHVRVAGLDVSIENPAGSVRTFKHASGKIGATKLKAHYGYIKGTKDRTGEQIDIFIKPGTPLDYAGPVHVADTDKQATGRADEYKVLLGWSSVEDAHAGLMENYNQGWNGLHAITRFESVDAFKKWLEGGNTTKRATGASESRPMRIRSDDRPVINFFDMDVQEWNDLAPAERTEARTAYEAAQRERVKRSFDDAAVIRFLGIEPAVWKTFSDAEREEARDAYSEATDSLPSQVGLPEGRVADPEHERRMNEAAAAAFERAQARAAVETPSEQDIVEANRAIRVKPPGEKFYIDIKWKTMPTIGTWESQDGRFSIVRDKGGYLGKVDGQTIGWYGTRDEARIVLRRRYRDELMSGKIANPYEARSVGVQYREDQTDTVAAGWKKLAEYKSVFRFRNSNKKSIDGILGDMGQAGIVKEIHEHMGEVDKFYKIIFSDGEQEAELQLHADGTADINAAKMVEGSQYGAALYQAALVWGKNNKIVIVPMSSVTVVNSYRRTENMLSAALRLGTTKYMRPHPDQGLYGWIDNPKSQGEEDWNVALMAITSMQSVHENLVGGLSDYRYNFRERRFEKHALPQWERLTRDDLEAMAKSGRAREIGAGRSTIARAIFTRSLLYDPDAQKLISGEIAPSTLLAGDTAQSLALYSRPSTAGLAAAKGATQLLRPAAALSDLANQALDTSIRVAVVPLARFTSRAYDRFTEWSGKKIRRTDIGQSIAHGMTADYGLDEPYINARDDRDIEIQKQLRRSKQLIDKIGGLTMGEKRVAYQWMQEKPDTTEEQRLLARLPDDSRQALVEMKQLLSNLGRQSVELGLLSEDTYQRNNMAYLARSYEKHVLRDPRVAAAHAESKAIRAERFRHRGLRDDVELTRLPNAMKGDHYVRLELRGQPNHPGGLGPLRRVVYLKAGTPIPATYGTWRNDGVWEYRFDNHAGNAGMWRDFTKAEREQMGEIEDVSFAFAKSVIGIVHDVETAKFLKWVMEEHSVADEDAVHERGGVVADAVDKMTTLKSYADNEWVQVPGTVAAGTRIYKYGLLQSRYIPGHIWNDIRATINFRSASAMWRLYDQLLRAWKVSKTALSPAVHTNNVMSNFILADLAEVRNTDIIQSLQTMIDAERGDDAARALMERYLDSGAELGTPALQELKREVIEPLLKQIQAEENETLATLSLVQAISLAAHGNVRQALAALAAKRGVQLAAKPFRTMIAAYQLEDSVFRLAKWLKETGNGVSDREAGRAAREAFLDYRINAPWIAAMRRGPFPFLAFTYRVVPILAEGIAKKPWKFMKYAGAAYAVNALAYAMLHLMGSDADEDKERKLLPDEKSGTTILGTPRLMRMPWNDAHGSPVFLDIRRWIPGGDIFDINGSHGAIPMPQWLSFGGFFALAIEMASNKSQFTGKEIWKQSDTMTERVMKTMDYLFKFAAPNLPLPDPLGYAADVAAVDKGLMQTYAWKSIMDAGGGKTDDFGRERSLPQALASAVGVKVASYPEDQLMRNIRLQRDMELRDNSETTNKYRRESKRGGLSESEFDQRMNKQNKKREEIMQRYNKKLGLDTTQ